MDNVELQSLIDELDELSAWLWMGWDSEKGSDNRSNTAVRLDNIINKYRPEGMLGD